MSERAIRVDSFERRDESVPCYWWDVEHRRWYLWLPDCGLADLSQHAVTEHEDGTISVSPSILLKGCIRGTRERMC